MLQPEIFLPPNPAPGACPACSHPGLWGLRAAAPSCCFVHLLGLKNTSGHVHGPQGASPVSRCLWMCEVSAGLSVAHGLCGAWTRARARPLPALHAAGWQGGEEKPHLPLPLRWADGVPGPETLQEHPVIKPRWPGGLHTALAAKREGAEAK